MKNDLENFVFEEHILRVDNPSDKINKLKKLISKKVSFLIRPMLKIKLRALEKFQKESYERYSSLENFFQKTSDNTKNALKYNPNTHNVMISGSGIEIFKCNGNPVFKRESEFGGESEKKRTNIPVKIGKEEATLILYEYPSIDFGPFDDFEIHYSFETKFSLGGNWGNYLTKNQKEEYKNEKNFFCGVPGRVYYRANDALSEEFCKAIFRSSISKEKPFNLYGKCYIKSSNELLYQGNFEVEDASFPFFIREDEEGEESRKTRPKIEVPAS